MTLKTQTLLEKVLALRDLQLLYQSLLLERQLLKRGGRLLLVRRLQKMRLLNDIELQLFLQLLYRLLQLLPAQFRELVLMLQAFQRTAVNLLVVASHNLLCCFATTLEDGELLLGVEEEADGRGWKNCILTLLNKSQTRIIRRGGGKKKTEGS